MDVAIVVGSAATLLGGGGGLWRWFGTWRSERVTGVSPGWVWASVISNAAWWMYGLFAFVWPQTIVATTWLFGLTYLLWRLNNRTHFAKIVFQVVSTLMLMGVVGFTINVDVLGWIGGGLGVASVVPQAWRTWRTRDINGIVPSAWVLSGITGSLMLLYGAAYNLTPMWITNSLYLTGVALVLAGWWRARNHIQHLTVQ